MLKIIYQKQKLIWSKDRALSDTVIAKLLGVSRQSVYNWRVGKAFPRANHLIALKNLFRYKEV